MLKIVVKCPVFATAKILPGLPRYAYRPPPSESSPPASAPMENMEEDEGPRGWLARSVPAHDFCFGVNLGRGACACTYVVPAHLGAAELLADFCGSVGGLDLDPDLHALCMVKLDLDCSEPARSKAEFAVLQPAKTLLELGVASGAELFVLPKTQLLGPVGSSASAGALGSIAVVRTPNHLS